MIPAELRQLPRWVCARRGSKVPMQAGVRRAASPSDPATWCNYETAARAVANETYDDLGFVFNGDGLVGVDIDAGFDPDGFLSDTAVDCMRACRSYTEYSRSGRGIHIILRGKLPFKGRNNRAGVEIYSAGRYFIITGKTLIFDTIVECQSGIDHIVNKYFPDATDKNGGGKKPAYSPEYSAPGNGKISLRPKYPPMPEGGRNSSLASLAGQLHTLGYTKEQITAELLRANREACKPPLPEREVLAVVNSITRYKR